MDFQSPPAARALRACATRVRRVNHSPASGLIATVSESFMFMPLRSADVDFGQIHEALTMTAARTAATSVLERFPDHRQVIVQLYSKNDDFRELCDHFAECRDVLTQLNASTKADAKRIEEYETLISELEQEIRTVVDSTG
jgi:hypothetical protein